MRPRFPALVRALLLASLVLPAACGGGDDGAAPAATGNADVPGTRVSFAFDDASAGFFDAPYPSDLRLDADGRPVVDAFPNPFALGQITGAKVIAHDRKAFSVLPVAYFRFSAPLPSLSNETVIPAATSSPILLVDVDPASPDRGKLVPVVADDLVADEYMPENVLAVSPRPGFVLRPSRKYAVVVRRSLGDAAGAPLGVPKALVALSKGASPGGAMGDRAKALYGPLFETLDKLGVARDEVAAATVFSTTDVVAELSALSDGVKARDSVTIDGLAIDAQGGAEHERFCALSATVDYPQYQVGKPPFYTDGLFAFGPDGLPVVQRKEKAPIILTLPKGEMPKGGFPLVAYFHGSGGDAREVMDLGPKKMPKGEYEKGTGVSHVLAPFGFATVGSALPVSPDRLPGAEAIAYLNIDNLAAMRDTFRQGILEQRMFLEALRKLSIPKEVLAGCPSVTLPAGETAFHFAEERLTAQGLSMGGAYTNMIGAVEPRIRAVVPTGAGGYWTYFIMVTSLVSGKGLGSVILRTGPDVTFQHPVLALLEQGWETIDPLVFMPRLAAHPLPNHPARPIYEPVGKGDKYFPTQVYDATALAYENQLVGDEVWPTMRDALTLRGPDGFATYPVKDNKKSDTGVPYTGAVVQFEGDGIGDPHVICAQLDAVKYQFGCFHSTFDKTGKAVLPKPAPLGTPCE